MRKYITYISILIVMGTIAIGNKNNTCNKHYTDIFGHDYFNKEQPTLLYGSFNPRCISEVEDAR